MIAAISKSVVSLTVTLFRLPPPVDLNATAPSTCCCFDPKLFDLPPVDAKPALPATNKTPLSVISPPAATANIPGNRGCANVERVHIIQCHILPTHNAHCPTKSSALSRVILLAAPAVRVVFPADFADIRRCPLINPFAVTARLPEMVDCSQVERVHIVQHYIPSAHYVDLRPSLPLVTRLRHPEMLFRSTGRKQGCPSNC